MNDRPTWTYKRDLPDVANPPRDLEAEQEAGFRRALGDDLWNWICANAEKEGAHE